MISNSFSIYNASAGSGKTYNLVKEYLKIILVATENDAYRNILAITFTNKAVNEMKLRIVSSLSEFANDLPNKKAVDLMTHISQETDLSVISIKLKSQKIIKHLIHNYAAFDISTIDKFTHKIIRSFAHDLGLPITFEVSLDTENLLTEAVDSIIAEAGEDEVLTKLLVDFTMEKTDNDKSWDIAREIIETGRLALNENNRNEIANFEGKKIEDFVQIKIKLTAEINDLNIQSVELGKQIIQLIENNSIDKKSFKGGFFIKHVESVINQNFNKKNKKYYDFDDISINKSAVDKFEIEQIVPTLLEKLDAIYKTYEKKDLYIAFLKNITPLSLLNTVSAELTKIQNEQNILSISEFNALIYNEIKNQPAPFIYERIGERYRHFFIDEFQDTSEMQWQNLIPLIDNATSSMQNNKKGTLMIVGDPKQSIYRWRGGKAEQFIELSKAEIEITKNPFNNPDVKVISLGQNYRSYSQIIAFNNAFFQNLANEFVNEDYKDLYQNHSVQQINNKIGGFVNISFIPKLENLENDNSKENEDENDPKNKTDLFVLATLKTIEKVINQGFNYKDIVVLTRKRNQGTAIANYLTEQKIPVLSSENLMIANATEIRFIIHLLKYLKNKNDTEAKAHFLEYLAQKNTDHLPVNDFIMTGIALQNETDFEAWLKTFDLTICFANLRKKSLYETIESLLSVFIKTNNAYIQYFLDIVLEKDVRQQLGVSDFLRFWDKNSSKFSIPSPEGTNAVRIMTIHTSKGLEFPVVIFPFADEDYNRKPKDKLWLDADAQSFGISKVLIDNSNDLEGFGDAAKTAYYFKKQEELLDNINVLYVALTRAEEQLYIISAMNLDKNGAPRSNQMSSFFINYLKTINVFDSETFEYNIGNPTKLSANHEPLNNNKKITAVAAILNPKNIKIAQRESVMWGTERQESIEFGNLMHEVLAFVKTKSDVDLALKKATENGLITADQKELIENKIIEIINHPELADFFNPENKVLNEQTIIQKDGNIIKPDKMVIKKNKVVYLLDYKTGVAEQKHKTQLKNYQSAIEKMDYSVHKNSIVYIGKKIEIVDLI